MNIPNTVEQEDILSREYYEFLVKLSKRGVRHPRRKLKEFMAQETH